MKKITLFVKFKEDNSIDYVSDTVLISKDDSDRVYIVDGQAEALKEILVSNQIIDKDSEIITQNDFDEALKLGCVNIVDMDKLDQDFYKNIMTDLDHTELTPEEQEEINNSITYIESISNEKEESVNKKNLSDENSIDEELDEDYDSKIDEEEINNKKFGIGAVGLAAAAGAGIAGAAGYAIGNKMFSNKVETQMKVNQSKQLDEKLEKERLKESLDEINNAYENETVNNEERSEYSILDFDMSNASQIQKEFLNSTAALITKFHEQTHKENNFRLTEDNEHYLDLTLDEAISLNIMLNDYSQKELFEIFGSHKFDSAKIQNSVNSAYTKFATYYMNAKEKSGLSDIIKDEKKKAFFENIENSVLKFNQNSTIENATEVHRQAYYKYITSGASNEYANDDFTSFIATSPLMGFIMNNSTTPYQVENFLITHLDDKEEEKTYGGAYLKNGTHFVALKKQGNAYVVEELDAFGNCVEKTRSYTTIMSLINDKALLNRVIKKADKLEFKIENANEKYIEEKENANSNLGLTLNEVVDKIDFSKLGGIYGINDYQAVGYLVNVRREIYTKEYLKENKNLDKEVSSNTKVKKSTNSSVSSNNTTNKTNETKQGDNNTQQQNVETTTKEEVQTKVETRKRTTEINREELTEKELKSAEQQEKRLEASNFVYNIAAKASIDVNKYMNSNEYQSDERAVAYINKFNDKSLNSESLINQARLIRAWNDGSLSEISTSSSQIITKRNEDAQNFIDSLSEEEVELLRTKFGSDWKNRTKSLYKNTWENDLKSAFAKFVNSLSKGEYLRRYKIEEEKLKQENKQNETNVVENNNTTNNNQNSSETSKVENEILPDETKDLAEGSKVITDVEENSNKNESSVTITKEENNTVVENTTVENEILPDETKDLGENEIKITTEEEAPVIDESLDYNIIEPVGLENEEAKGKVLTRHI